MAAKVELKDFLRTRRDRLRPGDVGLTQRGHRRVPGLRREEVAALAGVSTDYYVRLEQGRDITASADVLDALARALRLNEPERAHLHHLAKPTSPSRRSVPPQEVRPAVQVLMDGLGSPALVIGRRQSVLATNRLARALLADFDAVPPAERNHARWVFLEPRARDLYLEWDAVARDTVAVLRMEAGRFPDDEELSALVGELAIKSDDFARWWARHDVLVRGRGVKALRHPIVGDLDVAYEALALSDEDQTLFVYSVEPGSPSQRAMELLDSWTGPSPDRP